MILDIGLVPFWIARANHSQPIHTRDKQLIAIMPDSFPAPPPALPFHIPIIRISARQAPEEFSAALTTSASMLLGLAVIMIVHTAMEDDRANRRRLMLVVVSLTAAGILAPPLLRPLAGFIEDEEGFERRFECTVTSTAAAAAPKKRSVAVAVADSILYPLLSFFALFRTVHTFDLKCLFLSSLQITPPATIRRDCHGLLQPSWWVHSCPCVRFPPWHRRPFLLFHQW